MRTIKFFKSRDNIDNPDSLSRRKVLRDVCAIPPAVLGLTYEAVGQTSDSSYLSPGTMQQYETWLATAWELYYRASIQTCAQSIQISILDLDAAAKKASGVKRDQLDFMRSRFYQVASVVQRDQGRYEDALSSVNKALALAERINNPQIIAASLLRRARVWLGKGEMRAAYKDAQRMLTYLDYCQDPLKGKCLQMAGETASFLAGTDPQKQQQSLRYFDQALRVARTGNLQPDGSFVRTDLTSILIEKADAYKMFGNYEEALHTLTLAHKALEPGQQRWYINLRLTEASIYLAQKEIDLACDALREILPLVRAMNLSTKEKAIQIYFARAKKVLPITLQL